MLQIPCHTPTTNYLLGELEIFNLPAAVFARLVVRGRLQKAGMVIYCAGSWALVNPAKPCLKYATHDLMRTELEATASDRYNGK